MTPVINRKTDLAIAARANPIAGSQYEWLPWPSLVRFYILADGDGVFASLFTGSNVILEPSEVDQRPVTEPINVADDVLAEDVVGGGERLGVELRNESGAARVVRTRVVVIPAA